MPQGRTVLRLLQKHGRLSLLDLTVMSRRHPYRYRLLRRRTSASPESSRRLRFSNQCWSANRHSLPHHRFLQTYALRLKLGNLHLEPDPTTSADLLLHPHLGCNILKPPRHMDFHLARALHNLLRRMDYNDHMSYPRARVPHQARRPSFSNLKRRGPLNGSRHSTPNILRTMVKLLRDHHTRVNHSLDNRNTHILKILSTLRLTTETDQRRSSLWHNPAEHPLQGMASFLHRY